MLYDANIYYLLKKANLTEGKIVDGVYSINTEYKEIKLYVIYNDTKFLVYGKFNCFKECEIFEKTEM